MKAGDAPFSGLHFLVVEDQDFQRSMLAMLLTRLGAGSVRQAADGHTALALLDGDERPVDIVISDLEMPGMDGMEFIRRLGEAHAQVGIIVASSLETKLINSVAIMTGAYGLDLLGVAEKPLSREKLEPLVKLHQPAPPGTRRPSPALSAFTSARAVAPFTLDEICAGVSGNEFEVFLQPKVELGTGAVKGAEALARWRHPGRGIAPPAQFIKQLEDNGRIADLTWVVLRKACAACRAWQAAGSDATVSINLSLTLLSDDNLASLVTDIVRGEGLEPCDVILEVTESATSSHLGRVLENLARLRMNGFGLSIDDYGTGYSSMQQLARIPYTELKIDQSFVTNATRRKAARVMLESSLELARKLGITAVAEGVESTEDVSLLRELGCDLAQGYFIARPMDTERCVDWMQRRLGSPP